MLDRNKLSKEIKELARMISEINLALAIETDLQTNVSLRSARGELRVGMAWMCKLYSDLFGELHDVDIHESTWRNS